MGELKAFIRTLMSRPRRQTYHSMVFSSGGDALRDVNSGDRNDTCISLHFPIFLLPCRDIRIVTT